MYNFHYENERMLRKRPWLHTIKTGMRCKKIQNRVRENAFIRFMPCELLHTSVLRNVGGLDYINVRSLRILDLKKQRTIKQKCNLRYLLINIVSV